MEKHLYQRGPGKQLIRPFWLIFLTAFKFSPCHPSHLRSSNIELYLHKSFRRKSSKKRLNYVQGAYCSYLIQFKRCILKDYSAKLITHPTWLWVSLPNAPTQTDWLSFSPSPSLWMFLGEQLNSNQPSLHRLLAELSWWKRKYVAPKFKQWCLYTFDDIIWGRYLLFF